MGRQKKGFNTRAREQSQGVLTGQNEVDQLQEKVLSQDQKIKGESTDTNQLVLPAKKRTLKKYKNSNDKVKVLSKKRRKILQRVVDEKKKKAERGNLLEQLKEVQIPAEQLSQLTSLSSIQTKGVKRQLVEESVRKELAKQGVKVQEEQVKQVLDNPAKKMKIKKILLPKPEPVIRDDVLGFEASSSEDESEQDNDNDEDGLSEHEEEQVEAEMPTVAEPTPPPPVKKEKKKPAKPLSSEPKTCLLYTSPSPRDRQKSRMPSSA